MFGVLLSLVRALFSMSHSLSSESIGFPFFYSLRVVLTSILVECAVPKNRSGFPFHRFFSCDLRADLSNTTFPFHRFLCGWMILPFFGGRGLVVIWWLFCCTMEYWDTFTLDYKTWKRLYCESIITSARIIKHPPSHIRLIEIMHNIFHYSFWGHVNFNYN